jgi:glycosyltransferase involved in cell wall biosynthesis
MRLSVIVPVHNERENIPLLLGELQTVLQQIPDSEVIVVDDGSTDGTQQVLREQAHRFPFLRVIELARNYGQTAAIAAGMDSAKGEVLLPMDGDGQNDPADIPRFLAALTDGVDIVSGWRKSRKDAFFRSLFSRVANRLIRRTSGQEIHDYGCTMKAYSRSTVAEVGLYGDMHRFLVAYCAVHGARVVEIEANHRPRVHGKSKYGFGRIWRVILDLFLLTFFLRSFTRPMQFFGSVGLWSIILGVLTVIAAVIWRFAGGPTLIETPLPTLAALFVIVGVQCLLMGVLAEMQMRTYFESGHRKTYRIRAVHPHA